MTTTRRPPGRYDDHRGLPRWASTSLAAALAVGLAVLTFSAWHRFSARQLDVTLLGYTITDAASVEVRFRVERGSGAALTCTLAAYDREHQQVGSATVAVPAGGAVTIDARVTTSRRAAAALVSDCAP